jgi:hypothetical protein
VKEIPKERIMSTTAPLSPWSAMTDLARQQMSIAAETSGAIVRGLETMRGIQLQYWQQVAGAALEMQTEMMGCATHLLDSETLLESAAALEAFDKLPGANLLFPFSPGARKSRAH